jgi:hypothetical protein
VTQIPRSIVSSLVLIEDGWRPLLQENDRPGSARPADGKSAK